MNLYWCMATVGSTGKGKLHREGKLQEERDGYVHVGEDCTRRGNFTGKGNNRAWTRNYCLDRGDKGQGVFCMRESSVAPEGQSSRE
jgi:hypothetical protein